MFRLIFFFFLFSIALNVFAQERCGTVEYEKLRHQRKPGEGIDQFESWMKEQLAQKKRKLSQGMHVESGGYTVPIVVHVIHSGESVGTGTNISDAQIISQIAVLNNDFQRMNADTVKTPAEFKSVAGKFPITFVLAKQDPNGQATNGILRVKGAQTSWSINDNYTLKSLSYWPAESYLNIWVTNLSGGYLGYTQFPTSTTLKGLEDASTDRLTDGVVIDYLAFGTTQAGGFNLMAEYNLGRTTTHEVGHFFGLRHTWGDTFTCDTTYSKDYVYDTPIQDTNYNGTCPSSAQTDCGVHAMFDNYMNYTDDACMNIYSKGQVSRMDVIINNSPRRVSLLTSLGSQDPVPVTNDLQLKSISSPDATACSGSIVPMLVVRNFGSNAITSSQIQLSLNGNSVETKTFALNLAANDQTTVSFSSIALNAGTTTKFSFQVLQTNATTDGRAINDTLSISARVPQPVSLPLVEPFNTTPSNWSIVNPDGLTKWKNIALPNSNHAMYLDFYNYENAGASDFLITPVLDLTTAAIASLSFDYAYALLSGGSTDQLRVLVSTNCDFNSSPVEIFNQAGSALATTSVASGSAFTPTSSQWASKLIPLNQFVGQKIQIAFVGVNAYGNNLYLDNVTVIKDPVSAFALGGVITPSPVSCLTSAAPVISIKNLGNTVINSFAVDTYINNQKTTQQISNVQLDVNASKNISLAQATFSSGSNAYSVVIKSPNGVSSGSFTKDSLATKRVINSSADIIPLRQNFDGNFEAWTTMSPDLKSIWYPTTTNKKTSMLFDAFTNTRIGEQAWLVSPVLDLSSVTTASVIFETSYALHSPYSESLKLLASTDCGENFDIQLKSFAGEDLYNKTQSTAWTPSNDDQWTKQQPIVLDELVGKKNVRLAFVAVNGNGNNLYLDNIEFFVDSTARQTTDKNYRVWGGLGEAVNITFNLQERQSVAIHVYDIMGRPMREDYYEDVLNQTYKLIDSVSPGVYIVRVQLQSPAGITTTKVMFAF